VNPGAAAGRGGPRGHLQARESGVSLGSQTLQFLISGLSVGAIYALIALGFGVIYNATQIVNFAQGEFVMLGALLTITLYGAHVPLPLAGALAVAAVVVVGAVLERVAIRPLRGAGVLAMIIVTIGLSFALRGAAMLIWGKEHLPLRTFSSVEVVHVGGATVLTQSLWVIGITLAVMGALQFFYARTTLGKAMRAAAISREGAALVGISSSTTVFWSFALAGGLGAVAGILIAPIHMAAYQMGTMLGLKGFAAAILGGIGSSVGAIAGGLALGVLEALGTGFAPPGLGGYKDAFAFVVLLLVLFVRPAGLFGARADQEE
jgi:branched-chain amino acid transport system permease protein